MLSDWLNRRLLISFLPNNLVRINTCGSNVLLNHPNTRVVSQGAYGGRVVPWEGLTTSHPLAPAHPIER